MRTFTPRLFLFLFTLLLTTLPAHAHDPLASNVNVWVRPTGIDVELYMARSAAALLIAQNGETLSIAPDNFPTFQPRLQAIGTSLLTLTAGTQTLAPDLAKTAITDENDVVFNLHYPLPAAGPLKIHANYLAHMAEGHVGNLFIMDPKGADYGWGEITPQSPDLTGRLPPFHTTASATTKPSASATASAPSPASTSGFSTSVTVEVHVLPHRITLIVLVATASIGLLLLLLLLFLLRKNRRHRPTH